MRIFIQRYNFMRDAARKKLAITKIQKFGRYVVESK
jgi:myosin-5